MSIEAPTSEATCGVVVTYHPDDEFPARLGKMLAAAPHLVVVDNNSNPGAKEMIRRLAAADPRVHLIENPDNLGIAAALNTGVECARGRGFPWVLLFDQDTDPYPDLVATLAAARAAYADPGRVATVGAMAVDKGGVRQLPTGRHEYLPVPYVITSGSLLSVRVFTKVGPFRADFFIDSVDREYGFRLWAAGYHVILATRPGMVHVWGEPFQLRVGKYRVTCTNHSPLRRYYITRNWLRVMGEYCLVKPLNNAVECRLFLIDTAKAVFLEPQGGRKARAVLWGVLDAARGRMGRTHPKSLEG